MTKNADPGFVTNREHVHCDSQSTTLLCCNAPCTVFFHFTRGQFDETKAEIAAVKPAGRRGDSAESIRSVFSQATLMLFTTF